MQNQITINILNKIKNKNIGIWGFGETGKSVLNFLTHYTNTFFIFDSQPLTEDQINLIKSYKPPITITIVPSKLFEQFLQACHTIVPSPGVDISPYLKDHPDIFIQELDIFASFVKIPYIAITGSVGKTTTTHLLQQFLSLLHIQTLSIGNIGIPVLEALSEQNKYDYFVIETSSFQLEHTVLFKPFLATIINITENHLDRHKTMENYLLAKGKILAHQTENDMAILPMDYINQFWPLVHKQKVQWVNDNAYDEFLLEYPIFKTLTCKNNLILILAIIEHLGFNLNQLPSHIDKINRPEHRMELVKIWNDITFYNDSKSTTPTSVIYAIEQCRPQKTILLLGGLSKGIDRKPLIKKLKKEKHIKEIICFGAEKTQLQEWCTFYKIKNSTAQTLEQALNKALEIALPHDIILLSPGGSSFDLFKNFIERGNQFKKLVYALK